MVREKELVILDDATSLLKYKVYRNNILIFTRNKTIESNYKVKILFKYDDMKRYEQYLRIEGGGGFC